VKDLGFKLGRQWWAAKYSNNPAKFKLEILLERKSKELIWPEVKQCRWWLCHLPTRMLRTLLQNIQTILQSSDISSRR
jgi:hypothetical protein